MMNLRTRIYLLLTTLVLVTLLGGLVMVWYTYRMEGLLTHIISKNMATFYAAEGLEISLVNQKGFVSYYFLDGDPDWLRQLGEYRQIFKERLKESKALAGDERQMAAIAKIEAEYGRYVLLKDQVILHYKGGDREAGARLHKETRNRFFNILNLCDAYKALHREAIEQARDKSFRQARNLRFVAGIAILTVLILGVLLAFVLTKQILIPIRRLALEADRDVEPPGGGDEVNVLSQSVRGLIKDADHTQVALQKSRETLLQAEKLASVGKLAAGMAHSIRNPLTSVKMRLFSLHRALELSPIQRDDFEVISEEIRHIDTIVQNFLEFSRPPKLKTQKISPSEVVDLVLQLLRHRLESYNVAATVRRQTPLPEIQADPEQLKEVLINLLENACEAMEGGGAIVIQEDEGFSEPDGPVVIIRITDTGPGIQKSIQEKVFQPFFTTREDGTGLGLSIAGRIMEGHGGGLELISERGEGTTFVITLPIEGHQS
ncbi:MAG: histidine kinase [Deltaproteobacteria bacterium]|nr:histidine kinase [Deltaproteobacteria bacterium]